METLIAYLEKLKSALPVKCTLFNLQRLKIQWADFKNFLLSLPDQLAELKNNFLARLETIKIKIDAVEGIFGSWKEARYAFQEATVCLKQEMDAAILKLQDGNMAP
jgi:hypothetical protein